MTDGPVAAPNISAEQREASTYDEFGGSSKGSLVGIVAMVMIAIVCVTGLVTLALNNREVVDSKCPASLGPRKSATNREPMIWIGIDLPSNAPDQVRVIAREIKGAVASAIEADAELSRIKVTYDPGEGGSVMVDECFDGLDSFSTSRANEINRNRALTALRDALGTVVEGNLASLEPAEFGGPLRLLSEARNEAAQDDVVILWSDFLANDKSCLDGEGLAATRELAAKLVDRCAGMDAVGVGGKSFRVLGAGSSARSTGFEEFAHDLVEEICKETENCQ